MDGSIVYDAMKAETEEFQSQVRWSVQILGLSAIAIKEGEGGGAVAVSRRNQLQINTSVSKRTAQRWLEFRPAKEEDLHVCG